MILTFRYEGYERRVTTFTNIFGQLEVLDKVKNVDYKSIPKLLNEFEGESAKHHSLITTAIPNCIFDFLYREWNVKVCTIKLRQLHEFFIDKFRSNWSAFIKFGGEEIQNFLFDNNWIGDPKPPILRPLIMHFFLFTIM